jgi:hypothetical protein
MTMRLYLEEDSMRHAPVRAIRSRGVDVSTALEAGMLERQDEHHLAYATAQGRALCSFNNGIPYAMPPLRLWQISPKALAGSPTRNSGSFCALPKARRPSFKVMLMCRRTRGT